MTTKQLRRLCDLVQLHGLTTDQAAKKVGISAVWARACLRSLDIPPPPRRAVAWYAAYRRRDDALIAYGTISDLCSSLHLTPATVRTYASTGNGRYYIIRLEGPTHDAP